MSSTQFLDLNALYDATLKKQPFPYVVIPQFIKLAVQSALVTHFPEINHRGSIPALSTTHHLMFQQFITELEGPLLRQAIAQKFSMDLENKPSMLTLRGNTTERDGAIHTDSKSKLITLLLYMNPIWESTEGKLRLLKNKDSLDDYVEEISPLAGNCLIFKVTPNCWHGHTSFVGKRYSLQLNYLTNQSALTKHLNHHRFTAWLKRLFPNRNQY